jgi:alpha-L-fucosidase
MSGREGIHTLIDIVAKGGNLLLNIAPGPDGTWQQGAYDLLKAYGSWLKVNGEAIYNSKAIPPFKENNICMTQQENGNVYFLYLAGKDEVNIPDKIAIKSLQPAKGAKVTMLGSKVALKWKAEGEGFVVAIPASLQKNKPCDFAWTIKVSKIRT